MAQGQSVRAASYLTYRDVYGRRPSLFELEDFVRNLRREDCLQTIGKLSRAEQSQGLPDTSLDLQVLAHLRPERNRDVAIDLIRGRRRKFLFSSRLSALARVAILVGQEGSPTSFQDGRRLPRFVEALLAVTDVFDEDGNVSGLSQPEKDDRVLSIILRRVLNDVPPQVVPMIGRVVRIFVEIPLARPELVTGVDLHARFRQEVGIEIDRYLAITFAALDRYYRGSDPTEWLLTREWFRETGVSDAEVAAALGTYSATCEELKRAFCAELAAGRVGLEDLRPFVRWPLVEVRPGVFIPVDLTMLAARMLGDGVYWRLRALFHASDQEKSDFGNTIGRLLEAHCWEVAEAAFASRTEIGLFPEISYGGQRGPDAVIFEDDETAFVEIGSERPNVRKTLEQGDLASYRDDIKKIIIERARKLDRKIADFRDERLRYEGHSQRAVTRIHPVLCLMDGFPVGPRLRDMIDDAIARAGLLQAEHVEPLSIMSVEEFEALCALVERGESFLAIIRGHRADPAHWEWPFRRYILDRFGEIPVSRLMDGEYDRITKIMTRSLFPRLGTDKTSPAN